LQELMQVIQIKENVLGMIHAKSEQEILEIFENINSAMIGGD